MRDVVDAWEEGAPDGTFSEWRFDTPAGTSIVAARVTRDIGNRDEWTPYGRIDDVDQPGESCMRGMNQSFCRIQGTRTFSNLNAHSIAYGVRCVTAPYCAHLWDLHAVWVLVLGATVTVDDREGPVVSSPERSGVADGRWWNRAGVLTFSASDNTGVRRRRVVVDGVTRVVVDAPGASAGGCGDLGVGVAYSYARPCADARGLNGLRSVVVEPCGWGDGVHSLRGGATDTGGLDALSPVPASVRVDCSAPTLSIDSGAAEVVAGSAVEPVVVASDPASGVSSVVVEMSVDGGGWAAADGPVIAEAGRSYAFRARAFDVAGNATGWVESSPVLGLAPPVVEEDPPDGDVVVPEPSLPAPPVDVLATVAPAEGPATTSAETTTPTQTPTPAPIANQPARVADTPSDPLLRITRVLIGRRVVDVRGTAAAGLKTRATVVLKAAGKTVSNEVAIAAQRWRSRFRRPKGTRVKTVEIRSRAAPPFSAGTTRWREKDRPPLRRTR
ncbi:MAG TPA: hypothetical protein VF549_06570 [Solirubrobacteraceae bacterium]